MPSEALRLRCLTRRSSVVLQLPFRPDPISAYRFCAIRSITNHTRSPGAPQFRQLESYVDDSKVLLSFSISDAIDAKFKLEDDLRNVTTWCCTNDLLINPEKTKFMFIGTKQVISKHSVNFTVSFIGRFLWLSNQQEIWEHT